MKLINWIKAIYFIALFVCFITALIADHWDAAIFLNVTFWGFLILEKLDEQKNINIFLQEKSNEIND